MGACGMGTLGLESRERAQTAGGCVAVFLRLRGGISRSAGSTVFRHCCSSRSLARADDLTSRPGHPSTSDLASTTLLRNGPGRPAAAAAAAAGASFVDSSRQCCAGAAGQRAPPPPQEGVQEEAARRRLRWRRAPATSAVLQLLLLLLLSSVLRIAECCSSRANPRPRSPSPSTRRPYTFQTQPCPPMYQEHYCLNGTCFKVNIGNSLLYNCECADGFMGQRCETKNLEGSYSHLRRRGSRDAVLETASIAGGAGVALLVCVLLAGLLYVWRKRHRKLNTAVPAVRFSLCHQTSSHVVEMEAGEQLTATAANEVPPPSDVTAQQPHGTTAATGGSALVDSLPASSHPQSSATEAPP